MDHMRSPSIWGKIALRNTCWSIYGPSDVDLKKTFELVRSSDCSNPNFNMPMEELSENYIKETIWNWKSTVFKVTVCWPQMPCSRSVSLQLPLSSILSSAKHITHCLWLPSCCSGTLAKLQSIMGLYAALFAYSQWFCYVCICRIRLRCGGGMGETRNRFSWQQDSCRRDILEWASRFSVVMTWYVQCIRKDAFGWPECMNCVCALPKLVARQSKEFEFDLMLIYSVRFIFNVLKRCFF